VYCQIYPVINGKELNPITDKMCAVFYDGLLEKEREREGKETENMICSVTEYVSYIA
jgi:hypothetical protein